MAKRKEDPLTGGEELDKLEVMPLGAGNEVGRSCIYMSFKGKHVLFDAGLHIGQQGFGGLPFYDEIDPSCIDVLLVTHFHLDHAASLPYLLFKTNFKGRVFMTHATKAVYRLLLSDFVKVTKVSTDGALFTEQEIQDSMERIEVIDFHQVQEVNGIRFWCYVAGHVLGAAMFAVEIAGVRVLYTGDYSREEDRHLKGAELPPFSPDLCIIESTFGIQLHEPREVRERRFLDLITQTVLEGGRVLIPAFVFGRAQELLLILDDHWKMHAELQNIPLLYASPMARKAMVLYSTYTGSMNDRVREQCECSDTNPFDFSFVKPLRGISEFEDKGPCVVMASPGGLQSGMSRQLFDMWCQDSRNVCLIPGFTVEGTLAKTLLSEPKEVPLMNGQMVPLNMQVHYISFAAHADFRETSTFLESINPPNIVLVHGEATEMGRLRSKLIDQFKDRNGQVLAPKNCQTVDFLFKGDKTARAVGKLAHWKPRGASEKPEKTSEEHAQADGPHSAEQSDGNTISGVLVQNEFTYQLVAPEDLSSFTQLSTGSVVMRQAVPYQGPFRAVKGRLSRMFEGIEDVADAQVPSVSVGGKLTVAQEMPDRLVLQWVSDPVADMVADAIVAVLLQLEGATPPPRDEPEDEGGDGDSKKAEASLEEQRMVQKLLHDMFGDVEASKDDVRVRVDHVEAVVSLPDGSVECEDNTVRGMVEEAVSRLLCALRPVSLPA